MLSIAFSWTSIALLAGEKNRTRRAWNPSYKKRFSVGMIVEATDKRKEYGGKVIALIELTQNRPQGNLYYEKTGMMTEEDYSGEGFHFYECYPMIVPKKFGVGMRSFFEDWKSRNDSMVVIHFRLVEITPYGQQLLSEAGQRVIEGAIGSIQK